MKPGYEDTSSGANVYCFAVLVTSSNMSAVTGGQGKPIYFMYSPWLLVEEANCCLKLVFLLETFFGGRN
jgi:hypothetical protein